MLNLYMCMYVMNSGILLFLNKLNVIPDILCRRDYKKKEHKSIQLQFTYANRVILLYQRHNKDGKHHHMSGF